MKGDTEITTRGSRRLTLAGRFENSKPGVSRISFMTNLPTMPIAFTPRRGTSYLEVQVAMVLMSLGAAGLYSMSVVQTRQTARITAVLPAEETAALNRASDPWERKLGVYAEVDAVVIPDSPAQPDLPTETLIDNQELANLQFYQNPADSHGWTSWNYSPAYDGNAHYHYSLGNVGSYAQFTVTGLDPGEYEVYTTYPALGSLGTSVIHEIRDGGSVVASVTVDQTQDPSQLSHNGRMWDKLGFVEINSGTLRVRLLDGSGAIDYILADAILVRSRRSLEVVSIADTANGRCHRGLGGCAMSRVRMRSARRTAVSSQRRAFSLLEVTIGSMLAAMVAVMASGIAFDVSRHLADNIAESQVSAEARLAIESLRRDLGGCCPDATLGDRSRWRLVGRMIPSTREIRLCYDADRDASADWVAPDRVIIYSLDGNRLVRSDAVSGNVYTVARFVDDIAITAAANEITIAIDFRLGEFVETYTVQTRDVQ